MFTIRSSAMRSARTAAFARLSTRPFSVSTSMLAQGSYGGSGGTPEADNPQEQGQNPKVDQEHPGPGKPSAAKGNESQPQQSSSSSSDSKSSGAAQPKIHSKSQPEPESEDVAQHNREFENRDGKQNKQDDEKVDPKYWKGHAEDQK